MKRGNSNKMNILQKIFGGVNLTWSKVIIMGVIMGVYTAVMAMLPIAKDTSFSDLAVTFEVWIFFGIFIIMNSKSAKDSALKCFVFFLISQPLVYLVQDIVNGSSLFSQFYGYWFLWTLACLPMSYIGYYMKKDKWWGLAILAPVLILLGSEFAVYLSSTAFAFPKHILTTIFCIVSFIIYPLAIFKNKKIKIAGLVMSAAIMIVVVVSCVATPPIYSTEVLGSGDDYVFDDTYKVYLTDDKYGDLKIVYVDGIKDWMIHADFKKTGKTEMILESPDGEKIVFDVTIGQRTYDIERK